MVVDPISNYLGSAKMIDEQRVRAILTPLKEISNRRRVSITGVMHLNKKVELDAIHRIGGAMAYDRTHGVIVLFGGINNNVGYYDDTWIFDGTDWIQQNPATVPTGRSDAVLAQDSTTDGLVMFGGQGSNVMLEIAREFLILNCYLLLTYFE